MAEAMEPQALQIVVPNEKETIILNEEVLSKILEREEIKDRFISIISITGVFRQGKSFLLNFLLRYLHVKYVEQKDVTEWLNPTDGPLKGFSWASGSRRHTTGIQMWSEVFLTTLSTGEEVAIILLDTQGAFDNQSRISDCATIFALSTLISSVQIYNLMRNIKQYDLTHLQHFGGYGKLVANNGTAPFQNLIFLVRDWPCAYEKPYGRGGGDQLLNEIFENNDVLEVQAQSDSIKELFNDVSCFLLPYPGHAVGTSASFNGSLDEIDEDFKKYVQEFVTSILAPENLVIKTVHGERIKAGDLIHYIKEYCSVLKEGSLPEITTVYKATVEAQYKAAVYRAIKFYKKIMDCDFKVNPKCYTSSELQKKHSVNKIKAFEYYGKMKKLENQELSDKYLIQLRISLDEALMEYIKLNNKKCQDAEEEKERRRRHIERINRSASARNQGAGSSSTSTTTSTFDAETVGTAVAVIGGIAALAFGVSKLFTSRGNND